MKTTTVEKGIEWSNVQSLYQDPRLGWLMETPFTSKELDKWNSRKEGPGILMFIPFSGEVNEPTLDVMLSIPMGVEYHLDPRA